MSVTVQGPDGNNYEFPDGTDKAKAVAYFKKKGITGKSSAPAPSPVGPAPKLGTFGDTASNIWEHAKKLVTGPYHAFTDAPQNREEEFVQSIPAGLGFQRMFVEPTMQGIRTAVEQAKKGNYFSRDEYDPQGNYRPSMISGIVDAIPLAGPWARGVETEAQQKGMLPALAGFGTDVVGSELMSRVPEETATFARNWRRQGFTPAVGKLPFVGRVARRGAQTLLSVGPDLTRRAVEAQKEALPALDERNLAEERRYQTDKTELENYNAEKTGQYRLDIQKVKDEDKAAASEHQAAEIKAQQDWDALNQAHQQWETDVQARTNLEKQVNTEIKALEKKVFQEANNKYIALGEKMADASFPRQEAAEAVADAYEEVRGSPDKIKPFKFIADMEKGKPTLNWNDYQGYLEEFRKTLQQPGLASDLKLAVRSMEDFIEKEMGKAAEARGLGAEWTDAQASWAKMRQTFHKKGSPVAAAYRAETGPRAARPFMEPQVLEQHPAVANLRDYDPALAAKLERLRELSGKTKKTSKAPEPLANKPAPEPRDPEEVVGPLKTKDLTDPKVLKPPDFKKPEVLDVPGLKAKDIKSTARHFSLPKERDIHSGLTEIPMVFVRKFLAARLDRPGFVEWVSHPSAGDVRFLEDLSEPSRGHAKAKIQEFLDKQPAPLQLDPRLKNFLRAGVLATGKRAGSQQPSDRESTAAAAERQAREAAQRLSSAP